MSPSPGHMSSLAGTAPGRCILSNAAVSEHGWGCREHSENESFTTFLVLSSQLQIRYLLGASGEAKCPLSPDLWQLSRALLMDSYMAGAHGRLLLSGVALSLAPLPFTQMPESSP